MDYDSMDTDALLSELQRRGLANDGSSVEAMTQQLRTSDALFSVDEDAPSFRGAIIERSAVGIPPCFPEVYEDDS